MKKLCILVTADNLEAVKTTAYENIPEVAGHPLLNIPVSSSGEAPATHWFCPMFGSKAVMDKMIGLKDLSEMELADPIEFLKSKNLKVVR